MTAAESDDDRSPPRAHVLEHDVFLMYAADDAPFVHGYLLPALGLAPERVFLSGELDLAQVIVDEIERGVRTSRIMVAVLSPAYLTDHWARFGDRLASCARFGEPRGHRLLPLLRADCELPAHLQMLVGLDFRDSRLEVWNAQVAQLRAFLEASLQTEPELPCPYPGLQPFTEHDAQRFFGRDAELDDIVGRLARGEREIYVIGASGSGKSSLIAAGVVPRLTIDGPRASPIVVRSLRPGERPYTRLAQTLEIDLETSGAALDVFIARHAPATSLLLIIDQLEELFAIAASEERNCFIVALQVLRADPRCVLVLALRADFYDAFIQSALWADLGGRVSRVDLGAIRGDGLRAVIERPARALQVYIERDLVERLLSDAASEPGALPLLQEALVQLWARRRHRLLTLTDYEALGDGRRSGLARAISERADSTIRQLSNAQETIALRILLRLTAFGEGRPDTRRQQPRSALRSTDDALADFNIVVQRFVEARLLTVSGDGDRDGNRVDLAHEILIHAWPRFTDWIRTWRSDEQHRRRLDAAAAAWRARGGGDGGLLDRVEYAAAVDWRRRAKLALGETAEAAALLAASETFHSQVRRLHRLRRALAFAVLGIFSVVVSALALLAHRSATESIHLLGRSYQETGRQLLLEHQRPLQALPYLIAARRSIGEPSSSLRMLMGQAMQNLPMVAFNHRYAVTTAAFSPDGTQVVTASHDGTAQIWDVASGRPVSPPLEHHAEVVSAAFSRDGTQVVTASRDGTAQIWSVASRAPASPPLAHHGAVVSAAFNHDGTRVVTASDDGTARIWNAASGVPASPPLAHHGVVVSAAFSRDGTRVVTASDDGTARIWDATSGAPASPPLQHRGEVASAMFSADDTRVVTTSGDTAWIWDSRTGKPLSSLRHRAAVTSAVFSPDGTRVVTAGADHAALVWNIDTEQPASLMLSHNNSVYSAVFSQDGTRVATASADQTARIWDAKTGQPLSLPLEHLDATVSATFSRDGAYLVTASVDHIARVWDASTNSPALSTSEPHDVTYSGGLRQPSPSDTPGTSPCLQFAHRAILWSVAFSLDGLHLVTSSLDHTARVWDAATCTPISSPLEHLDWVVDAEFSPDGTRVVTASFDRTARVWDTVTSTPLSLPLEHPGYVLSAVFTRDGEHVVTTSLDTPATSAAAARGVPPALHRASSQSDVRDRVANGNLAVRVWNLPLAPGTLDDWVTVADCTCPYALLNGVLSTRDPTRCGATRVRSLVRPGSTTPGAPP